jgi:SAM-dependent methyltransferase
VSTEPEFLKAERERLEADEKYHLALRALDRAVPHAPELPGPPVAGDESRLAELNTEWNVLTGGSQSAVRRAFSLFWRVVCPPLWRQKKFNAALIDHINRNSVSVRETQAATAKMAGALRQQIDGLTEFHDRIVRYAQSIGTFVDAEHRSWSETVDLPAHDWLKRWESLSAREQRFEARVAALEDLRQTVEQAQQTSRALKREVEQWLAGRPASDRPPAPSSLPSPAAPAADLNAFQYVGFEDRFRGSQEDIRARLGSYVPKYAGCSAVLDVGCGRGEFLDLLRAAGIGAKGLDVNRAMVAEARSRGLDAAEADALSYVRALPDASLDGVFSSQVVEHLEPGYLVALLDALFLKLKPGGVIALETINPACWLAFFESYIRDLTHVRALHPDTLQYLMRAAGFQHLEIEYRSPVPDAARLQPVSLSTSLDPAVADLVDVVNENSARLNARLFTFQDYAAVGRK